jgi:hypothetical protein
METKLPYTALILWLIALYCAGYHSLIPDSYIPWACYGGTVIIGILAWLLGTALEKRKIPKMLNDLRAKLM